MTEPLPDQPPRLRLAGLRSALAGPFDLAVAAGQCIAVAGPSGSGKSLLLRMIADLDPNDGAVALDGRDRAHVRCPGLAPPRHLLRRGAGLVARYRRAAFFPGPIRDLAQALMPRLGLPAALFDSLVVRLSTGERQRLALIRALVLDPPVLLLDEPTGALDQDSTAQVETLLRERLEAGTAILLVTHSPEQAGRLGHQQFRMQERRLVAA